MKQINLKQALRTVSIALVLNTSLAFVSPAMADDMTNPCPWIFSGSIGYMKFSDTTNGDTALGRLALGKEFFKSDELAFGSEISLGLELGVQTGNTMNIEIPQPTLNLIGGFPIHSTIKPAVDLLGTLRTNTLENVPLFMLLKAGAIYRQWQFDDRIYINKINEIAPEVQFGFGYLINDHAFASLMYQGIFGGSPEFSYDLTTNIGHVENIPSQNALLLGISFTI